MVGLVIAGIGLQGVGRPIDLDVTLNGAGTHLTGTIPAFRVLWELGLRASF